jgi:nucleotide-binding universal stress UspA family protein
MTETTTALRELPVPGAIGREEAEVGDPLLIADRRDPTPRRGLLNEPACRDGRFPQRPVKKVLVATDFSPSGREAVECAVAIANQCGAVLTVLHVIDVNAQAGPGESGKADRLMKRLWDESSSRMGQLAWSLSGRVEARTVVQEGLPWDEIVEMSRDHDLVVLGKSQAKRGWKLFSPHTSRRVIDQAACPVMVV